jgi:hypothetical protein
VLAISSFAPSFPDIKPCNSFTWGYITDVVF